MSLYDLTEFTWESTSESSSGVYRAVVGNNGWPWSGRRQWCIPSRDDVHVHVHWVACPVKRGSGVYRTAVCVCVWLRSHTLDHTDCPEPADRPEPTDRSRPPGADRPGPTARNQLTGADRPEPTARSRPPGLLFLAGLKPNSHSAKYTG